MTASQRRMFSASPETDNDSDNKTIMFCIVCSIQFYVGISRQYEKNTPFSS